MLLVSIVFESGVEEFNFLECFRSQPSLDA